MVRRDFTKLQEGGVIVDVVNAEQAEIAEESGAVAVMALKRVPADIRAEGGVARMADPLKISQSGLPFPREEAQLLHPADEA